MQAPVHHEKSIRDYGVISVNWAIGPHSYMMLSKAHKATKELGMAGEQTES